MVDAAAAAGVSERTAYEVAGAGSGGRRARPSTTAARRPPDRPAGCPPRPSPRSSVCAGNAGRGPRIARALGRPVSTVGSVLRRLGLGRLSGPGGDATGGPLPARRGRRAAPYRQQEARPDCRPRPPRHRRPVRPPPRRGLGWEYLHVAIDDASRLAYTELLPDERGPSLRRLPRPRRRLVREPRRPDRAGHDRQRFRLHQEPRVPGDPRRARRPPRDHPALLAAHQRQGRALHPDRAANGSMASPTPAPPSAATDMPAWLHWYNHHRPHAGIHALTPAAKLNNLLGNTLPLFGTNADDDCAGLSIGQHAGVLGLCLMKSSSSFRSYPGTPHSASRPAGAAPRGLRSGSARRRRSGSAWSSGL